MNEFLTLLVAQLQNQDPMNPTDPTQFVSQLAQFSTVEQLTQSNSTLNNISSGVTSLGLGQYVGLINQPISATMTSLTIPTSGSPAAMTFNVTTTGLSNVNVAITNANGTLVELDPGNRHQRDGAVQRNGQSTAIRFLLVNMVLPWSVPALRPDIGRSRSPPAAPLRR